MLKAIFKEIRIKQYTKNILVFAAALFAGNLTNIAVLEKIIIAFFAFCCVASAVYILNDIMDVEKDRQHPIKCFRPIAAGLIPLPMAWLLLLTFLIFALWLSRIVNLSLVGVIIFYFIMNVAYSLYLKHVVILDVMIIAIGFVLRAIAGVLASGTIVTTWFVVCIFMLSLFLALAKRRGELVRLNHTREKNKGRKVLKFYSEPMLNALLIAVLAISITSYTFFAMQGEREGTTLLAGLPSMMLTIPFVVYGMFRYVYLIDQYEQGEKPEDILIHDKPILWTCILFSFLVFIIRNGGIG